MNSATLPHIKAVLFDLDGTLIDVNLDLFIPGYIKLLANSVSHLIKPKTFIRKLMKASEAVNKNNGIETNDSVFSRNFFPIDGYTRAEIQPFFDKFYEDDFILLKKYTQVKPKARSLVKYVLEKKYDVVIATTPVLPETAIQQRLEWAGVGDLKFKLITSIENSRANKPNLIYYRQIVEFLDHDARECLMVGDEDKDMVASNIGCPTFLIQSNNTKINPETPKPTFQGDLINLKALL